MDFAVPEETRMLVSTMRQFVEKECLPVEQAMIRLNPDWVELPAEPFQRLRHRLKELGLWALDAPREWGGAGLDAVTVVFLTTEQCKTTVGTAHRNPFGSFTDAFFYPAFRNASDYLKERYLYPVIRGEKDSALAQTEPEAGSDAAAIRTTAERDGDYWVINGIKRFSTMADTADFIYVATVTEKGKGRAGHTTFIVDRDTPGLKMLRKIEVIRPQYSTELAFDNVRIHDRQRLTELGAGFRAVQAALGTGRTKLAASCLGRAERAQKMTIAYVKQRATFGATLATRQAIQWMLVDSHIEINATRLMALETAWKADQGLDVRHEASVIKLMATEMAYRVIDRAIQCHGGVGLTKDLPLERWLREVRVMRIVEGPSEVHKFVIARDLLRD